MLSLPTADFLRLSRKAAREALRSYFLPLEPLLRWRRNTARRAEPAAEATPPSTPGTSVTVMSSALTRKSRSDLYYGFLALPPKQRAAVYALFAFCRSLDDVDPAIGREESLRQLSWWRLELSRCFDGAPQSSIGQRLADAVRSFRIPRHAIEAIVDGVEMDIDGASIETFDDLRTYCYRVAGAFVLCMVEVVGNSDHPSREYAINLGIAIQLTNILRDVQDDIKAGRVYLPREDLRQFGVSVPDLMEAHYRDAVVELLKRQALRARDFYNRAWKTLPSRDTAQLIFTEIIGRTYFELLCRIEARGFQPSAERLTLPAGRKLRIAFGCLAKAHLNARDVVAYLIRPRQVVAMYMKLVARGFP